MGKGRNRKPFIDKSKATTYNLLYRASEVTVEGEDAGPERELVETSRGVGVGRPDVEAAAAAAATSGSGSRYPPGHPLAMFEVHVESHSAASFSLTAASTFACCPQSAMQSPLQASTAGKACHTCRSRRQTT